MVDFVPWIDKRWSGISAQKLLQRQVGGSIGAGSAQKSLNCLTILHLFQILNIENRHWVTVSNILTLGKHFYNKVWQYETLKSGTNIERTTLLIIKPGVDKLDIMVVDV